MSGAHTLEAADGGSGTPTPPSGAGDPLQQAPLVRIALLVPPDQSARRRDGVKTSEVDLLLPADVQIGDMIGSLLKTLYNTLVRQNKDVSLLTSKTPGRWTFSRVGGEPLPSDMTLLDAGLYDGDQLELRKARSTEEFQQLVDDVTEAATATTGRHQMWKSPADAGLTARPVGAAVGVLAAVAAAVLIGGYALMNRILWVAPALTLLAAAGVIAGASVALRSYRGPVAHSVAVGLIYAAYPLSAAGALALVSSVAPGPWGAFHAAAGAAAVMTVAILSAAWLRIALMLASLVTVAGIIGLAAALVRAFFSVEFVALGAGVTLTSMLLLSPKLAIVVARLPLPPVPNIGAYSEEPDRAPRFVVVGASSADVYQEPAAATFEQRAEAAYQYLTGMMWAMSCWLVAGTQMVCQPGHRRYWLAFIFTALVAFVIGRRARNSAARWQVIPLLLASAVIVAATLVRLALADGRLLVVLAVFVALLAGGAAAIAAGLLLPDAGSRSPVTKRVWEYIEWTSIALLPFLALWIMDVLYFLRGVIRL